MNDATRLRLALREYLDTLDRHRARLWEEQAALQASWTRTREVYQGEGADLFEAAFQRASAMMHDYLRAADVITPEMKRRLDALERFDAPPDRSA